MKKIEIKKQPIVNIVTGYELNDLSEEAREKVFNEWIEFEIETMTEESPYYYLAEKMERMQTPWFLGESIWENHKNDIIETIEINNFLFDEGGDILPILHHFENNKEVKTTYKGNACIINDILIN